VSDNRAELTSNAVLVWCGEIGVESHCIVFAGQKTRRGIELQRRQFHRAAGNQVVIGPSVGLVSTNALLVRRSGTRSCFSPWQRRPLPMAKSKRKRVPKTVLKLPDLEQSKSAVLNSLTSSSSKRSYDHAIREFIDWYCSEPRLAFNRTV